MKARRSFSARTTVALVIAMLSARLCAAVASEPVTLTNVTPADVIDPRNPTISPDGRLIAFIGKTDSADSIYVMQRDGSDARRLTNATEKGWWTPYYGEAWSPDGSRLLAFFVHGSDVPDPTDIVTIDIENGEIDWASTYSMGREAPYWNPEAPREIEMRAGSVDLPGLPKVRHRINRLHIEEDGIARETTGGDWDSPFVVEETVRRSADESTYRTSEFWRVDAAGKKLYTVDIDWLVAVAVSPDYRLAFVHDGMSSMKLIHRDRPAPLWSTRLDLGGFGMGEWSADSRYYAYSSGAVDTIGNVSNFEIWVAEINE